MSAHVGTVRSRTSRISQAVTLVAVIVPPLGIALAAGALWGLHRLRSRATAPAGAAA